MSPVLLSLVMLVLAAPGPARVTAAAPVEGVRYLYLVRHGMYDRAGDDDRAGNGINALGHTQARRIGRRLAALPVHLDTLYCSDLRRARETAQDIGRWIGRAPVADSLLAECTPAAERASIMKDQRPEELARAAAQLEAAWARYARPSPAADAHDVLVCHGNVIRWFVCRALGADPLRWSAMDIGNGSLTVLAVRADGGTRLVAFSDVGHLPVAEQTWTGSGPGFRAAGAMR